jgi:cytosine/adenosine deaminase-related metal-dependent hydrolase
MPAGNWCCQAASRTHISTDICAVRRSAPRDFPEILGKLWWRLDGSLAEEDVRVSALVSLVDAIRHGTTTLFDHHASPAFVDGSLDVIAEAVEQAGVRAVLCYEVSERWPVRRRCRYPRTCGSWRLVETGSTAGGKFRVACQPASTLQACRAALPEGSGYHIHVAEHEQDQYDSLQKSNMRVVERLRSHEILGARTIAAHCVHVDAAEIAILSESGTWVTHQPRSNMNNAVGVAPVESMLRAGVRVCLGNDGFSNAMWEEWTAAYLMHKTAHNDPRRMDGALVAEMALTHNGALASAHFPVCSSDGWFRGRWRIWQWSTTSLHLTHIRQFPMA